MGCKRNWEVGGGPSLCLLSAYTSVFFSLYCPFSLLLHHMRKCGCTLVNQVSSYIERQTGCLRIPIPNSWERVTASPLSITSQKKEGLIPAGHVKGELFTARHPRRVIFFFFFFWQVVFFLDLRFDYASRKPFFLFLLKWNRAQTLTWDAFSFESLLSHLITGQCWNNHLTSLVFNALDYNDTHSEGDCEWGMIPLFWSTRFTVCSQ